MSIKRRVGMGTERILSSIKIDEQLFSFMEKCKGINQYKGVSRLKYSLFIFIFFYIYVIFVKTLNEYLCRLSNLMCYKNMFSVDKLTECGGDICSVLPSGSLNNLLFNDTGTYINKDGMVNMFGLQKGDPLDFSLKEDIKNDWGSDGIGCTNVIDDSSYTEKEKRDIVVSHTKIMNTRRLNSISLSVINFVIISNLIYKLLRASFSKSFDKAYFLKYTLFMSSTVMIIYGLVLELYIFNEVNAIPNGSFIKVSDKILGESKGENLLISQNKDYFRNHLATLSAISYTRLVVYLCIMFIILSIYIKKSTEESNENVSKMEKIIVMSKKMSHLQLLLAISVIPGFILPIFFSIHKIFRKQDVSVCSIEEEENFVDIMKNRLIDDTTLGMYRLPIRMFITDKDSSETRIDYSLLEITYWVCFILSVVIYRFLKPKKDNLTYEFSKPFHNLLLIYGLSILSVLFMGWINNGVYRSVDPGEVTDGDIGYYGLTPTLSKNTFITEPIMFLLYITLLSLSMGSVIIYFSKDNMKNRKFVFSLFVFLVCVALIGVKLGQGGTNDTGGATTDADDEDNITVML